MDFEEFKKLIKLVENASNEVITEARYDDDAKAAIASLRRMVDKAESSENEEVKAQAEGLRDSAEVLERKYTSLRNHPRWKDYPNTWKQFAIDSAIYQVLSARLEQLNATPLDELKRDSARIQKRLDNLQKGNAYFQKKNVRSMDRVLVILDHYLTVDYHKVKEANPYDMGGKDFFEVLGEYEDEYQEMVADNAKYVYPDEDTELFLDTGDYKWFQLSREYCRLEGDAMGHCGNTGSPKSGDTILSLRQVTTIDGEEVHRPSLTFILHGDNSLGEMKGRANEKPAERYHKYIIPLLLDPRIEAIRGGGYKADKNFQLDDLTDEQREHILEVRGEDFDQEEKDDATIIKLIATKYERDGTLSGEDLDKLSMSMETEFYGYRGGLERNEDGAISQDVSDALDDVWAIDVVKGNEHIEMWTSDIDYDSMFRYEISAENEERLINILIGMGDDLDYDEDDYDSVEEYVRDNLEEVIRDGEGSVEDLRDRINEAYLYAEESGAFGEVSKEATSIIEEHFGKIADFGDDRELALSLIDGESLPITPQYIGDFIQFIEYNDGVGKVKSYEQDYNSFDKEYFNQALSNEVFPNFEDDSEEDDVA